MSTTNSIALVGYKFIRKVIDGTTFVTAIREEGTQACDLVYVPNAPILGLDMCSNVYVNEEAENDSEPKTCRAHVSSCRLVKGRQVGEFRSFGAVNVERPNCLDVTTYPLEWKAEPIESYPIPTREQRLENTRHVLLPSCVVDEWDDVKLLWVYKNQCLTIDAPNAIVMIVNGNNVQTSDVKNIFASRCRQVNLNYVALAETFGSYSEWVSMSKKVEIFSEQVKNEGDVYDKDSTSARLKKSSTLPSAGKTLYLREKVCFACRQMPLDPTVLAKPCNHCCLCAQCAVEIVKNEDVCALCSKVIADVVFLSQ
jgi:hypothetical protein